MKKQKQIIFKTHNGLEIIRPDEIVYCEALGSYTTIISIDHKITISQNLKAIKSKCDNPNIIFCHKSYLINLNFITRICSNCTILLKNNIIIPVSRRRLMDIKTSIIGHFVEK